MKESSRKEERKVEADEVSAETPKGVNVVLLPDGDQAGVGLPEAGRCCVWILHAGKISQNESR